MERSARGSYELRPIGWIESSLSERSEAPHQGGDAAPDAWIRFEGFVGDALRGLRAGSVIIVLTWLDRARRDVLRAHPNGNPAHPPRGVFSTRSPDRPNPIGLHLVTIVSVDGARMRVSGMEALDRTPVLDVKPVRDLRLES